VASAKDLPLTTATPSTKSDIALSGIVPLP
jgi:hypothetical protein